MKIQQNCLPQIKIFDLTQIGVEDKINQYIIQCFNEIGTYPEIKHSGNFISVTTSKLLNTYYEPKPYPETSLWFSGVNKI